VIDVLDSFAARTLRNLAQVARLRGADTVIVGINPSVASTMTELGINVDITPTALDLDDGIAILDELTMAR
jgi:rsbT antagonist protein RsbS